MRPRRTGAHVRGAQGLMLALLVVVLTPAGARGATVEVQQTPGPPGFVAQGASLVFRAADGEANSVVVAALASGPEGTTYSLRDSSAPLDAGPGCSGGGPPGVEVRCVVPRSRGVSGCIDIGFCSDAGRHVRIDFRLGAGNDVLDAVATAATDGGGGPLSTDLETGPGDDTIFAGPTPDAIDPGAGADTVRAGEANDSVAARIGPADGPDLLDLGPGAFDFVSYFAAEGAVSVSLNDLADDGGEGEGDNVLGAEHVLGSPAADTLIGSDRTENLGPSAPFSELLNGSDGDDLIEGGAGDDMINAGFDAGNDVIRAASGSDSILAGGGDDRFSGGAGEDSVQAGGGDDRGGGGGGEDRISGNTGADRLRGGSGADELESGYAGAGDRETDRVDCGPSRDRATVGRNDVVLHCEQVKVKRRNTR